MLHHQQAVLRVQHAEPMLSAGAGWHRLQQGRKAKPMAIPPTVFAAPEQQSLLHHQQHQRAARQFLALRKLMLSATGLVT